MSDQRVTQALYAYAVNYGFEWPAEFVAYMRAELTRDFDAETICEAVARLNRWNGDRPWSALGAIVEACVRIGIERDMEAGRVREAAAEAKRIAEEKAKPPEVKAAEAQASAESLAKLREQLRLPPAKVIDHEPHKLRLIPFEGYEPLAKHEEQARIDAELEKLKGLG